MAALAGDRGAANKALEARSYAEAIRLLTPLAEGGNAEALFHLGEMHWYGEGVPRDDAQAKAWFEKAASAGNAQAGGALAVMRQRVALKAEIDFYVSTYDGADLAFAPSRCPVPVFPVRSERKADITRLGDEYNHWLSCYNTFVATLNSAMPPGKLIPAKVADIMNEQEFAMAQARMDQAYTRLGTEARLLAAPVQAQYAEWLAKTEGFVTLEHQRFEAARVAADAAVRRRANTDLGMTGYMPVRDRK
jgi:TPR repeat protein